MKLLPKLLLRSRGAFTFTEIIVAGTLLMLVFAGVLTSHLMGIRMFEITKAKLGANEEARHAINLLSEEVRTARNVKVGNGSINTFTEAAMNTKQEGSALQIYPTDDTNKFVRYFWDEDSNKLLRTTNGATAVSVVANSITNKLVFAAEDHSGRPLTNNENNRVIALTLQFYQIQYPIVQVGPGHYYDFYQLRTKMTRRAFTN